MSTIDGIRIAKTSSIWASRTRGATLIKHTTFFGELVKDADSGTVRGVAFFVC